MNENLETESIRLIRTIGMPYYNKSLSTNSEESLELYECAIKNKVPILYLESLKNKGALIQFKEELFQGHSSYETFLKGSSKLVSIFNEFKIPYVIFKTIKPYKAVPGDIDIVVLDDGNYRESVEILLRAEYIAKAKDVIRDYGLDPENYKEASELLIKPTYDDDPKKCISPNGTDLIDMEYEIGIDLQKNLAMNHVIYMNKKNFRENLVYESFNNTKIYIPSPELDIAIVIAHSFAEQMYLLGEFYTVLYRLHEMDDEGIQNLIRILKENHLQKAAKAFFSITYLLCDESFSKTPTKLEVLLNEFGHNKTEKERLKRLSFKLPHKYSNKTILSFLFQKMTEKNFRNSVGTQIVKMLNPKVAFLVFKSIMKMRKRETYLKSINE